MIPPGRRNRLIRLLAAVFFLLTAAVSLHARGARDNTVLSRADQLIENKEYDEAVQVLSDFMKENPDRFDEAHKRMREITRLRGLYSQIANELLDIVETSPDDSERIYDLSNQLLAIESPSNPAVRRFLDQIRYLAEFNINRQRLERILLAARNQLNQSDYSGALDTYASGLDIYQSLYFSSGYGEEAENVASSGLRSIHKNIGDFKALSGPLGLVAGVMAEYAVSNPPLPTEVEDHYKALSPRLDEITAIQSGFNQTRRSFETQLAINRREHDETGDRSFLSFAGMLLSGPAGLREGMIGTLEQFWDLRVGSADAALAGVVTASYNTGYAAMQNMNYTGAISIFGTTERFINTALEMSRKRTSFLDVGEATNYIIYGESVNEEKATDYLKLRVMTHGIDSLRNAGNIANRGIAVESAGFPALSSWQAGRITAQAAISMEQAVRQSFQNLLNELRVLSERISSEYETLSFYQENMTNLPGGVGEPQKPLDDTVEIVNVLNSRFRAMEYNSAVRRYTISIGDLETRVNAREKEFSEGNVLIQGISRETEWGVTETKYYPAEGLAILTRMTGNLDVDLNSARTLISQFSAEERTVLEAAEMNSLYGSGRDLLARLLSLQVSSTSIMASAREQVQRAAFFRAEGDRFFQAARTALLREDFDGARSSLSRAADQYKASRALQESDSLITLWDTQVVALNAEIDRRENEVIVLYVRDQITAGRNFYFQGNIGQAENALINAQNRWRRTNTTENQEVEYWLSLVRGALSLQSGRTIATTAPLYAEMSQLLSEAKRNYDEGARLLNSGRRQEGLLRFDTAIEKTMEVRLMFPLNHDARMVELRIEQQRDRAAFDATFSRRMNEAIAGTKARNQQSFAELEDLAEINPRYPNLSAIIIQAEIDIGKRPPPIDQRNLTRSTELTRSAEVHFNSRDQTRYGVARAQLEEAIRLNPSNTQAQRLLDQVMISTTGTGTIAIPRAVQDQYDAAFRMYSQGNYLQADAILQRLLATPANQRYTIIQELKRRNDAFL